MINFISLEKKKLVGRNNQQIAPLIIDFNCLGSLSFQLVDKNNKILDIDSTKNYYIAGNANNSNKVLFYSNTFSISSNILSFVVDTYTENYLKYITKKFQDGNIEIGISDTNYKDLLLRDNALYCPRVYVSGLPPAPLDQYYTKTQVDEISAALSAAIPLSTSQLTNDSGFITEHQSLDNYYTKSQTDDKILELKTDPSLSGSLTIIDEHETGITMNSSYFKMNIFDWYEYEYPSGDYYRLGNMSIGMNCFTSGFISYAHGNACSANYKYSHAEGYKTLANGPTSHAEGTICSTELEASHAEGYGALAAGKGSHAEGQYTSALANYSHAEGVNTKTLGAYSHAEGYETIAIGDSQHVQGKFNLPNDKLSFIIGCGADNLNRRNIYEIDWTGNVKQEGNLSCQSLHAGFSLNSNSVNTNRITTNSFQGNSATLTENLNSKAITSENITQAAPNRSGYIISDNIYAYSMRNGTLGCVASGSSHAEGTNTSAMTEAAHSEGYLTLAQNKGSHTEGQYTSALANYSHTEGVNTKTLGAYSHAEGQNTIAQGNYQHVEGKWNSPSNNYQHIVGCGTSDIDRKNSQTLDWSGNQWNRGSISATHFYSTFTNYIIGETRQYIGEATAGIYNANYQLGDFHKVSVTENISIVPSNILDGDGLIVYCNNPSAMIIKYNNKNIIEEQGEFLVSFIKINNNIKYCGVTKL